MLRIILIALTFFFSLISYAHEGHGEHLGKINFPTSGNQSAQVYFEHGVMWLHSFEYNEARADFQKAIDLDPNFAMAYWGEAMTYNHPLWSEQDTTAAKKILEQLALTSQGRVDKAKTPIEKGFMNALNLLYGEGDKKTRDENYAYAMQQLYQKNPDNDEIASFYALSLLGTAEGNRDFQTYMQAAGIAEEIYQHNPQHPGALHYLIHSYDDPIHAPLGLRAARAYAKAAPNASHALHMPSHIFLALGLWDDVIASNAAAWKAGVENNTSKDAKAFTIDDLHALEWLSYGYLEKQDYKKAYQLTKTMQGIAEQANSPMAKWYYALMRAAYISASHDWNTDLKSLDMNGIELSSRVSDLYINALIALNKHNLEKAKILYAQIQQIIPKVIPKKDTYTDYFTAIMPGGIKSAEIMSLELEAEIAAKSGDHAKALRLLKQATDIESQTSFGYGPPIPVKPSYELYGDFLLANKKYDAAYRQYIFSLKRMPNRTESLKGLDQAKQKLKENKLPVPEGIKPYFNKLMLPEYYH